MAFEWDTKKATANLKKYGVSFTEAATVFADPLSLTFPDPDHSIGESRYITMGLSSSIKLLLVAHTDRDNHIRISQCQRSNAQRKEVL